MKVAYTPLAMGLDLVSSPAQAKPGMARLARNYETDANGNYRSLGGYSAIGGGVVPGTGIILGLYVFQSKIYALRETAGVAKLYWTDGASAWAEIVPAAGSPAVGRYDIVHGTFFALANSEQMFFQCAGSGKPWQFDGTTFSVIAHANTPVGGDFLAVHSNHLVVGRTEGQIDISSIGDPEDWDATTGSAAIIGVSDTVTGLASSPGGILTIMCDSTIQNLYGTSKSTWQIKPHSKSGVKPYTAQSFGNSAKFLSDRGLTSLEAVQAYGDFSMGEWGRYVDPLFDSNPVIKDSTVLREKNQYWLFTGNKTALIARFYDAQTVGMTTALFPHQVEHAASGLVNGIEQLFVGDDAGNVFQLNSGTSFAGTAIDTTLVTHYNPLNSDTQRKRFNRLFLDIKAESAVQLATLPQFDYGDEAIARHLVLFRDALAAGGSWGIESWDQFAWSSPLLDQGKIDVTGTATNIGLVINSSSAIAAPHTLIGYTTHYTPRRLTRG